MEPRFLVVLNTYADPKAAVDAKKFYQPRGYDVLLMTEEHSVGGMYKLILGPFPTLEVAQEARDRFVSEFVNTKPVIVTINK